MLDLREMKIKRSFRVDEETASEKYKRRKGG